MLDFIHKMNIFRSDRQGLAKYAVAFAYLMTLAACGHSGLNDNTSADPGSTKPILRVGTSGDYAPFSVASSPRFLEAADAAIADRSRPRAPRPHSAAVEGFSIDLIQRFADSVDVDVEWVPFRWPNLLADLKAERFELAASGITLRPDRSLAGRFSLPVTKSQAVALVAKGAALREPGDLNTLAVGLAVNRGGHLERVARSLFPDARIFAVPRNQAVLEQLSRPDVHAVLTDTLEAPHWEAMRPGLRRIGPLTQDRKAVLFQTKAVARAKAFDAWLLRFEASGELAQLRKRWALPDDRTAAPAAALLAALDERLALMPAVARAKRMLDLPVEDRARETRVLDAAWQGLKETAQAEGRTVPHRAPVLDLFRAQIEAAKWIQREERSAAISFEADRPEAARAALDEQLRPALIRLGDQITSRLLETLHAGAAPPTHDQVRMALGAHSLPTSYLAAIQSALDELLAMDDAPQ